MSDRPLDHSALRGALEQVLAGEGLRAVPVDGDDDALLVVDGEGDTGAWPTVVLVAPDDAAVVAYAYAPGAVDPERLGAVAELCHRANLGLVEGCLELDLDDGQLRARAGAFADGIDPVVLVDRVLHVVADLVDAYGTAIADVLEGADPAEAVATAES